MEAYFLFRGGRPEEAAACGEQEEDIGSPSTSASGESSAGSSSELDDDATSSSGSGSGGFEMSGLMAQLPFKRGLSRFFDGRSQSFASLAAVGSLEDLAKPSRSCGGGLDAHRGRLLSPRGPAPSPPQQQQQRPASGRRP